MKRELKTLGLLLLLSVIAFSPRYTLAQEGEIIVPSWRSLMILEDIAEKVHLEEVNLSLNSENEDLRSSLMKSQESLTSCQMANQELKVVISAQRDQDVIMTTVVANKNAEIKKHKFQKTVLKILLVVAVGSQLVF